MFKPNANTEGWEIPGVEWREYSDEEFERVMAEYDERFDPAQAGSARRFFDHVAEKPKRER